MSASSSLIIRECSIVGFLLFGFCCKDFDDVSGHEVAKDAAGLVVQNGHHADIAAEDGFEFERERSKRVASRGVMLIAKHRMFGILSKAECK